MTAASQRAGIGGGGIRLDVGAGEGVRIAGAVDGGDVHALGLEGLGDAGGAGEEIEGGAGAGGLADPGEDGDEAALGTEVFDHRGASRRTTLRWAVMAPGDHPGTVPEGRWAEPAGPPSPDSHWVRWHSAYEDPSSSLSLRLRAVQSMVRAALDEVPARRRSASGGYPSRADPDREPVRRPGAGRHRRGGDPSKGSGGLGAAGRARPGPRRLRPGPRAAAGRAWPTGSGSSRATPRSATGTPSDVPADIVLVCGVFGNISAADITRTIQAMRGFCVPGGHVVWTRHRRPPDLHAGHPGRLRRRRVHRAGLRGPRGHRHDGRPPPPGWGDGALRPRPGLFDFVGDGSIPHEPRRADRMPTAGRADRPDRADADTDAATATASTRSSSCCHGVAHRPDGAGPGHRARHWSSSASMRSRAPSTPRSPSTTSASSPSPARSSSAPPPWG